MLLEERLVRSRVRAFSSFTFAQTCIDGIQRSVARKLIVEFARRLDYFIASSVVVNQEVFWSKRACLTSSIVYACIELALQSPQAQRQTASYGWVLKSPAFAWTQLTIDRRKHKQSKLQANLKVYSRIYGCQLSEFDQQSQGFRLKSPGSGFNAEISG